MTPAEWNGILAAPSWTSIVPVVISEVTAYLDVEQPDPPLDTRALMEVLYPVQFSRGEGIDLRWKLLRILQAPVLVGPGKPLEPYYTRGAARLNAKKKMVRPFLWHARKVRTCPHCGGVL